MGVVVVVVVVVVWLLVVVALAELSLLHELVDVSMTVLLVVISVCCGLYEARDV